MWSGLLTALFFLAFGIYMALAVAFWRLLSKREPSLFKEIGKPGLFSGKNGGGVFVLMSQPHRSTPPVDPTDNVLRGISKAARIMLHVMGWAIFLNLVANILGDKVAGL